MFFIAPPMPLQLDVRPALEDAGDLPNGVVVGAREAMQPLGVLLDGLPVESGLTLFTTGRPGCQGACFLPDACAGDLD